MWSDQNRELPVEGDWHQPDMLVRGQEEEKVTQASICNPRGSVSPGRCPPGPVSSEDLCTSVGYPGGTPHDSSVPPSWGPLAPLNSFICFCPDENVGVYML